MLLNPANPVDCLIKRKVEGWQSIRKRDLLLDELRTVLEHEIEELLMGNGQTHPPIDPLSINRIGKCEIDIHLSRELPYEGRMLPSGKGFIIDIRCKEPSRLQVRERLSIAHEIAHAFFYETNELPPRTVYGNLSGQWSWKYEGFCHEIARRILVPSFTFSGMAKKIESSTKPSIDALRELCRLYKASREVVGMRFIKDTARWPAILIKSTPNDDKGRSFEVKMPFPIKPKRVFGFEEFQFLRVPRLIAGDCVLFPHISKAFALDPGSVLKERVIIEKGRRKLEYDLESSPVRTPVPDCTTLATRPEDIRGSVNL